MKVAQKIKHAKIHMQKFIQNPFSPLNPPTNQTHKSRKIIKSTWKKQTQKFKINTMATRNHQTQSNLIRPSFHSHSLLFFLSRPFPKIKSLYLSLSPNPIIHSLFLFLWWDPNSQSICKYCLQITNRWWWTPSQEESMATPTNQRCRRTIFGLVT